MKKNIILILAVGVFAILGVTTIIISKTSNNSIPTYYTHATYAYDMSTPEKVVGATNYTFVGKVKSLKSMEYRDPIEMEVTADGSQTKIVSNPYTIYNVEVVKNIKGNLVKEIELVEYGGYSENEKAYIYFDEMSALQDNHYYLFMAFAVEEGGELQITSPYSYVDLKINDDKEIEENKEYQKYVKAYENQIVPDDYHDLKSKYDINK